MTESNSAGSSWFVRLGLGAGLAFTVYLLVEPPMAGLSRPAQNLAAITVLMATLWITQVLDMAVTSLIPLFAFPILGIQPAEDVSGAYIDENVFLYMGGFIIALGIEKWGLHHRMALHIVRLLGTQPRRMVLGFMLATGFLSMWISNTAATLLMLPIGLAMLTSLRELPLGPETLPVSDRSELEERRKRALAQLGAVLLLGIAYAASIGGFTTLVGTPTNGAFLGIWKKSFPTAPPIPGGQWMMAMIPLGVVFLLAAWGTMTWNLPAIPGAEHLDRGFFNRHLKELGRPKRAEWLMLAVFFATAMLWIFRTPFIVGDTTLLPGWQDWWVLKRIGAAGLHDSTVAMAMAILMFMIPARKRNGQTEFLMDWKTAEKLPWGILLLFGGGFALAGAFKSTGLSEFLGKEFSTLIKGWSPWLIVAGTAFLLTFLSELTSNVATVVTVVPMLAQTSVEIGLDPRLVMIPATIAASCGYMLPVATPPNAIVFGTNYIPLRKMLRYGFALDLIGVVLITLAAFLLMVPQMGISLDSIPDWAIPAKSSAP